jgi:cytochrome P450 family 6
MYPPLVAVTRECTKPVTLRGTDVTVEKGMLVLMPILGLHHDSKYYPDPERFDPERFSEEEKKKRPHFSYLPFGEGPRMCIGSVSICNFCKSR